MWNGESMKDNHQKHLTLSDRIIIEKGLNEGKTFTAIATAVGKDPTTISKEIRKHRTLKQRKDKSVLPRCTHEKSCQVKHLCNNCYLSCNECNRCRTVCMEYLPKECGRLRKAPYICIACPSVGSCRYFRWIYVAKFADDSYHEVLVTSREGINQTAEDMQKLDNLISPLIMKGQSIAHIFSSHKQELLDLNCSRRTLYDYIDQNLFTARNIDLPRKVKYKPRKKSNTSDKKNPAYRNDRKYLDFEKAMLENPNIRVVEMDTVEGQKGGKVLLTLLFRNCNLMLAFLLDEKSQKCVKEVFDFLSSRLGTSTFQKLFPVILTDNGSEFQNPEDLEYDQNGEKRTKIFYCEPNCSWQKGAIEKNHEFIRYIVPKGYSFDQYTQEYITLMINHINSTARDSLNGCTPFQLSQMLINNSLHELLSLTAIPSDEIILKPVLLKH